MLRKTFLSTAVAILAASLVACGGGGSDDDDDDGGGSGAQANMVALTVDGELVTFARSAPNTIIDTITVTGLDAGDTIVGIDVRPLDGNLYALTRNSTDGTAALYEIGDDGVADAANKIDLVDAADSATPITLADGLTYSVDFNPAADALRIISSDGRNLRVFPTDRAAADPNPARTAGDTITDGAINRGEAVGDPSVSSVVAAAYTNSSVSSTRPASTQLFVIDTNTDVLALQNPPNDGDLQDQGTGLGVAVDTTAGFDIGGTDDATVVGAFNVTGDTYTLYEIDLDTGTAALPAGLTADTAVIGGASGPVVRDIAIR